MGQAANPQRVVYRIEILDPTNLQKRLASYDLASPPPSVSVGHLMLPSPEIFQFEKYSALKVTRVYHLVERCEDAVVFTTYVYTSLVTPMPEDFAQGDPS